MKTICRILETKGVWGVGVGKLVHIYTGNKTLIYIYIYAVKKQKAIHILHV